MGSDVGFAFVDYAIVVVYLVGVTVAGIWIAGRQRTSRDYFLGGKEMSWWSVGFSIVASETSTLTFISVPGLAYQSNMHFLQLALGYFIGRLLVSVVFIPAYYRGDLETAYDFLGKRFGLSLRKFTSTVFIVTRVLASGVRLFATAIPVHMITGPGLPEQHPADRRFHPALYLSRRTQGGRGDGRRADVHLPERARRPPWP